MLILKSFYNRGDYISPEDEITIYNETKDLFKIWKDIILNHSNDRITDLTRDKQELLSNIIPYLKNIKFSDKLGLAPQLDRQIVDIILWGASNFLPNEGIIDEIYKKTRGSMFQYFHHDLFVNAYLKLKSEDKALEVIKYMFNKDHVAYYYAILKYNINNYKHNDFLNQLHQIQSGVTIKLLSKGERVSINNASFDDLLKIVNGVKSEMQ